MEGTILTPVTLGRARNHIDAALYDNYIGAPAMMASVVQSSGGYNNLSGLQKLKALFTPSLGYPLVEALQHVNQRYSEDNSEDKVPPSKKRDLVCFLKVLQKIAKPAKVLADSIKPLLLDLIGTKHESSARKYAESIGVELAAA